MKLYIQTQVFENYGDAENPHWKAKGGSDYFVENITAENQDSMLEQAIDYVSYSSDYYIERFIRCDLVADDFVTQFERDQLDYEGKITFPALVIQPGVIVRK
jgi:hypothetical protein